MASISYDPPEILRAFTTQHHLGYPLLSDHGSAVIKRYGILNTNIPKDTPAYGIPFPGSYLINPDGTVRAKFFLTDYRNRVTASEVLLRNFDDAEGGNAVELKAGDLRTLITLSADRAARGHELGVAAEFAIEPGWHIYGRPLPNSYVATSIVFDSELVADQSFDFPDPEKVKFKTLGETLPVYQGEFKASGRVLLKPELKPGDYRLKGKLRFQECNDQICKIPQTVAFEMPLKIYPIVGPLKK